MSIKSSIKVAAKPVIQPIVRMRSRPHLSELRTHPSGNAERIAAAIEQTLRGHLTVDERRWVDAIEARRKEMDRSTDPIHQKDFGAGAKAADRDATEAAQGVDVESTLGHISTTLSRPYLWSLLLFKLIRQFQPAEGLELGTAVGVSAAYQAAAQQVNGAGRFRTLEGSPEFAEVADRTLDSLGLDNAEIVVGRFADTLADTLGKSGSLSYAFIDGHHDEQATLEYFETILPSLADNALVVFDDIRWSAGMTRAWQRIVEHARCSISVDLGPIGLCDVNDENGSGDRFSVPLSYL